MEEAIKGGVEQGRKRQESALAAAVGALTAQGTGAEGLAEAMVAIGWEATPPGWAPQEGERVMVTSLYTGREARWVRRTPGLARPTVDGARLALRLTPSALPAVLAQLARRASPEQLLRVVGRVGVVQGKPYGEGAVRQFLVQLEGEPADKARPRPPPPPADRLHAPFDRSAPARASPGVFRGG